MSGELEVNAVIVNGGMMPSYKTDGAAAMDLHARTGGADKTIGIPPGKTQKIPAGIRVAIPDGYAGEIRPRSGMSMRDRVVAILGTIDSDYRGEIGVILHNAGDVTYQVHDGDRIAQMMIVPVIKTRLTKCCEIDNTSRGDSGFGSTGR